MKAILGAAAILVVFGVGSTAFATTVTWDFDGVVTYVRGPLNDLPPPVKLGDPFSGIFVWNSSWASFSGGELGSVVGSPYGFRLNVGNHTFDAIGTGGMELYRQGGNYWQVGQWTPATPTSLSGTIDGVTCPKSIFCARYIQFVLALDGITGDVPIDPSNILRNTIHWRWFHVAFNSPNGQPFIGGNLTSLMLPGSPTQGR
jgi:hypothetical protein